MIDKTLNDPRRNLMIQKTSIKQETKKQVWKCRNETLVFSTITVWDTSTIKRFTETI